jgi:hypothetical protein
VTAAYEHSKSGSVATLPGVELNLGLTDFLEVELEVPFLHTSAGAFGLGDVSMTLKWLVVKERRRLPALVLGMETAFPTGSVRRGLGEGAYELKPFVAALKTLGPLVLQGNIGWSHVLADRSGEGAESIVGGVSIAVPLIGRKLYGFAELSGSKAVPHRELIVTVAPGLKWLSNDETFVAVALPIPLSGEARGVGILTQFQWGF